MEHGTWHMEHELFDQADAQMSPLLEAGRCVMLVECRTSVNIAF